MTTCMKWTLTWVVALAAFWLPAATGAARAADPAIPSFWDDKERLPKPDLSAVPRIRFLTTVDFPPFNFLDRTGRLTGFHVDLARAICAELGVMERCEIQALLWNELEGAIAKGDAEASIAGMAVSADLRKDFVFTRPYLMFPARFVTPKATAIAEPLTGKFSGLRVGVIAKSQHEAMLRDYFPDAKVVVYTREDWMLADLKERKLAAVFGDGMRIGFWLAGTDAADCCRFSGGPYLAPEYLGSGMSIAVGRKNEVLGPAFDYALQQLDAKGIFAELYLRYFPVSFF